MDNTHDSQNVYAVSSGYETSMLTFDGMNNLQRSESNPSSVKPYTDGSAFRSHARLDTDSARASAGDELSVKLSRINGAINKMTKEQLQKKLAELRLNTSGIKDILKKRLKNYYKRQRMAQFNKVLSEDERMKFDYLVVIDFEATCSETNENFVHEIIEFPAVLVDTQNHVVCHVFHRFCKPKVNPILTEFCTTLTGISQSQVDQAADFTQVFRDFEEWLSLHKLGTEHKFAILTDGPWDMARFLKTQVQLSDIVYPRWAKQWINLRKAYTAFYGCQHANLHKMLEDLGMQFEGRPHCGLDDARNIAAIVVRLLQDGCNIRVNEYYQEGVISAQKRNGSSRASGHTNTHRSSHSSHSKKNESSSFPSLDHSRNRGWVDVPQDGENLEDLLSYLKIQKS